jgi:hypothetical protein
LQVDPIDSISFPFFSMTLEAVITVESLSTENGPEGFGLNNLLTYLYGGLAGEGEENEK